MDTLNKILIIDDELSPREALRMILKDIYSVKTASSAEEGLRIISEDHQYSVAILDIKMPSMDGITALREIKKIQKDIEVVMVTAYASLETAQKAIQYGALDYLIKPFDHKDVLQIVEKGINKRNAAIEQLQKQMNLEKLVHKRTKELEITEKLLKTLYENANDGIIIMDKNGFIINANQQASKIHGYEEGQLLGMNIESLETDMRKSLFKERLTRLLNGEALIFETEHCRKDETKVNLEISSKAIEIDEDLLIQSMLRDISEKKRLHAQLLYSQKMESIGTLAGGIAHDFKNILTSILGNADLIVSKYKDNLSPDVLKRLESIESSIKIGSSLVSNLLDFARRGPLEIVSLNINTAIEETINILSRILSNIEIIKELDHSIPVVKADRSKINQVMINLLINARDAMPRGGKIMVKTGLVKLSSSFLQIQADIKKGNYIHLCVKDTGTGIAGEKINSIFEPFYTTKEEGKGTGLGLSIVYGIIKEFNGYITVDSNIGEGTTFNIYLPVSTVKILVIDDEIPVLELIKGVILNSGYDVEVFNDINQFYNYYRKTYQKTDIVLVDTVMPFMDANKLIMDLKSLKPQIKIIALTGFDQHSLDIKVDRILEKPLVPSKLISALNDII